MPAYTHINASTRAHMCTYVHTHNTHKLTQIYKHIHMHAHTHTYTRMHTPTHAYTYVRTCIYTHTHMCMHTCADIPYMSKHLRGKTFMVGQQNGHSRENICN